MSSFLNLLVCALKYIPSAWSGVVCLQNYTPLSIQELASRLLSYSYALLLRHQDDGGWTPLVWAAEYKHTEVIKYIMEVGGDPNIRDKEGNTGLHWACYSGAIDVAVDFLNAGCDIEVANEHGDRSLYVLHFIAVEIRAYRQVTSDSAYM